MLTAKSASDIAGVRDIRTGSGVIAFRASGKCRCATTMRTRDRSDDRAVHATREQARDRNIRLQVLHDAFHNHFTNPRGCVGEGHLLLRLCERKCIEREDLHIRLALAQRCVQQMSWSK